MFIDEHRHLSGDGTTRSAAATSGVHGVYVIRRPRYRPLATADKDDSVADWSYLSSRAAYEVSDAATGCCLPARERTVVCRCLRKRLRAEAQVMQNLAESDRMLAKCRLHKFMLDKDTESDCDGRG